MFRQKHHWRIIFVLSLCLCLDLSVARQRPQDHKSYSGKVPTLKVPVKPTKEVRPSAVRYLKDDLVRVDFPIEVKNKERLTALEKKILTAIQSKQPISFHEITRAWMELHLRRFNKKNGTAYSAFYVSQLLDRILMTVDTKDPFTFKADFERRMKQAFHKKPLFYNADFTNPIDVLLKNRMQCLSGTRCHMLLGRKAWSAKDYMAKKPVVVFQDGHVAPGYIALDDKNKDWVIAVETTAAGKGRDPIGPVSMLAKKDKEPAQVVDGNLYPLVEIFSPHLSKAGKQALYESVLKASGERLGFDYKAVQANIRRYEAKLPERDKGKGGSSAFGFGIPDAPKGDQVRHYIGGEVAEADPTEPLTVQRLRQPKPKVPTAPPVKKPPMVPMPVPVPVPVVTDPPGKFSKDYYPEEWLIFRGAVVLDKDRNLVPLEEYWKKLPLKERERVFRMAPAERERYGHELATGRMVP